MGGLCCCECFDNSRDSSETVLPEHVFPQLKHQNHSKPPMNSQNQPNNRSIYPQLEPKLQYKPKERDKQDKRGTNGRFEGKSKPDLKIIPNPQQHPSHQLQHQPQQPISFPLFPSAVPNLSSPASPSGTGLPLPLSSIVPSSHPPAPPPSLPASSQPPLHLPPRFSTDDGSDSSSLIHVSSSFHTPSFSSYSLRPPDLEIDSQHHPHQHHRHHHHREEEEEDGIGNGNGNGEIDGDGDGDGDGDEDLMESFHLKEEIVNTPTASKVRGGKRIGHEEEEEEDGGGKGAVLRPKLLQSKSIDLTPTISTLHLHPDSSSVHPPPPSSHSVISSVTPLEWLHSFSRCISKTPSHPDDLSVLIRKLSVSLLQKFSMTGSYAKYEGDSQVIAAAIMWRAIQICIQYFATQPAVAASSSPPSESPSVIWKRQLEEWTIDSFCSKLERDGGRFCRGGQPVEIDRRLIRDCCQSVTGLLVKMPQ